MILMTAIALGVLLPNNQAKAGLRQGARKAAPSTIAGSITDGADVKVTVVGTGKWSNANGSGFFLLSGTNLAGSHRLNFIKGGKIFSTIVRVPAGSKLSLQNTQLKSDGSAQAEQEDIEAVGTLSAVDCVYT